MFGSQILEVAMGLALVYLLLSLICSEVVELIARALALRSQTLEDGVRRLLNDPEGTGLAGQIYSHQLMAGLSPKGKGLALFGRGGKPSYLPSRQFVLALFDLVAPADASGPKAIQEVRATVANISDEGVRRALLTLIDAAGNDIEQARQNVEGWFNEAMERVSGWYKRKTQMIVLGLALGVSIALNADTLTFANTMWRDPTLRASMVAAAEQAAQTPFPPDTDGTFTRIGELQAELRGLDLPFGWSLVDGDPRRLPADLPSAAAKVLGLVLTTLALALGAPFWFDALAKLVQLRATGKPKS